MCVCVCVCVYVYIYIYICIYYCQLNKYHRIRHFIFKRICLLMEWFFKKHDRSLYTGKHL